MAATEVEMILDSEEPDKRIAHGQVRHAAFTKLLASRRIYFTSTS
jgi:hypothetical protein